MPSHSSPHSSQARRNCLFYRLSQAVVLSLFIFGVTATSSGEGVPTTTSIAELSQTLDHVSEGHSIPYSVTTESVDARTTIVDDHTSHPPVVNVDPLDHSVIETDQEVVAESNTSEDKEALDDFLAELFQNSESESTAVPADQVQTPLVEKPKPLTEEEIAERKRLLEIETREKRIEITGRHAQWETRLEEQGKEVLAELLKEVNKLRAYVSKDVSDNEDISKLLNGYESEANKAIKGVEVFFEKRIKTGKRVEKSVVKTWEDVLTKVEKKLDDKRREVEKEMQEYYSAYIEEEVGRVEAAIKRVEKFADDAQADLGMDYAWLDDVSVKDWTRYHDLGRTAKRWGDIYRTVFNSTHPELLSNEVVLSLEKFQATLQEIDTGFDHVLGNLERKAERIFKGDPNVEDAPSLGKEGVVISQEEVTKKATQKEDEGPIMGLGSGSAATAPVVHHVEL